MTVYQIFPQFSTKIKAVHSTQHAMNSLHSETISFYIFSQKSNAIHPAPLFSFPHPASDPALAFTCTMVKQPFPVYLPVLGVSVPAPSRIFRSATHTHTMNGQAASVQDFRTRYQPPAPPAEGSPPAIPRMPSRMARIFSPYPAPAAHPFPAGFSFCPSHSTYSAHPLSTYRNRGSTHSFTNPFLEA